MLKVFHVERAPWILDALRLGLRGSRARAHVTVRERTRDGVGRGTHGSHQQITTRDHNVLQQHQPQRRAHLRHLRRRLHNLRSRRGVRLWVVPPAQHTPARPVSSGRTPPNAPIQCTLGWRRGGLRGILGSWWTPGVHYPLPQCQYRSSVSETRLHALKKGLSHPWSPLALIRLFTAGAHFALVGQPLGAFFARRKAEKGVRCQCAFLDVSHTPWWSENSTSAGHPSSDGDLAGFGKGRAGAVVGVGMP